MGNRWLTKSSMTVRMLTDLSNQSCKDPRSIRLFSDVGQVRSLEGMHAKIYVIDDDVLVTSANLTDTAFSARYEIGQWLSEEAAETTIRLFLHWWDNLSSPLLPKWFNQSRSKRAPEDEPYGTGLPKKWRLGKDPGNPLAQTHVPGDYGDYRSFWSSYKELATAYGALQRVWPNAPLFLEVDCFLNYLFHEAPGTPSQPYKDLAPQNLNAKERHTLLRLWATKFKNWPLAIKQEAKRVNSMKVIQSILTKQRLSHLDWTTVETLVDHMHSLYSNALARKKFLNPKNNKLSTISKAWLAIVEPGELPVESILQQVSKPFGFGRSSTQELLGWSNPLQYPIRNANTNAGMRYFGYSVKKY
jgi:PLD-like domain